VKRWQIFAPFLAAMLTTSYYGYSQTNDPQMALVPFRAVVPYRGGSQTVPATSIIVKKIVRENQTILYAIVPPGPIFDGSDAVLNAAKMFLAINSIEFVAEIASAPSWSAETLLLRTVISKDNPSYVPSLYTSLIEKVQPIASWQEGNRYPLTTAKYRVLGYHFPDEVWESVRIAPVNQEAQYLGAVVKSQTSRAASQPIVTYRFKSPDIKAAGSAGNIIVDETGKIIAIVLEAREKDAEPHFTAIPVAPVLEFLKAFFKETEIQFP
jgi:hypothetical protein